MTVTALGHGLLVCIQVIWWPLPSSASSLGQVAQSWGPRDPGGPGQSLQTGGETCFQTPTLGPQPQRGQPSRYRTSFSGTFIRVVCPGWPAHSSSDRLRQQRQQRHSACSEAGRPARCGQGWLPGLLPPRGARRCTSLPASHSASICLHTFLVSLLIRTPVSWV